MDHFHLSIMKEMFRLTSRDYSVYWWVMVSPSRNLCILTGQERDSPTSHLAGDTYSTVYRNCCFLGLLFHRTKSFTDKKILNGIFGIVFTVAQRMELSVVHYILTELCKIV